MRGKREREALPPLDLVHPATLAGPPREASEQLLSVNMGLKGGYVKKAWRLPASHGLYTFDSTSSDKPAAIIDNQGMYFGIVLGMLAQKSLAHAAVQIALLHLGLGAFFDEVWIALEGGAGGGYKGGKAGRNGEPQSGRDGVYTLREASDVGGTLAVASRLLMTVVQPVLSTQQATHTTRPSFECLKFHTEADHVLAAVVNGMYASVDEADETMEENDDGSGEGEVAKSESASEYTSGSCELAVQRG